MSYIELPLIETSTPFQRLTALQDAKALLAASPEVSTSGIFGGNSTKPNDFGNPDEMIRLAEYITTGHDYKDTHPTGKRRPIVKHTHVTVVAPAGATEGLEHLLSHVADGSFNQFIDDLTKDAQPETADDEKSADPEPDTDWVPAPEDKN